MSGHRRWRPPAESLQSRRAELPRRKGAKAAHRSGGESQRVMSGREYRGQSHALVIGSRPARSLGDVMELEWRNDSCGSLPDGGRFLGGCFRDAEGYA